MSLAPENATSREQVRQLLYGGKPHVYRVLFKIRDDHVVSVIHVRGRNKRFFRFIDARLGCFPVFSTCFRLQSRLRRFGG